MFLLLALSFAQAQDSYKAENEGWLVSLNEAYKESKTTGKPIMANFTGSDWCIWCKRLSKAVFDKKAFKEWAEEHVVLLELDFPKKKKLPENIKQQNYAMQQQFQISGYPTVWIFHIDKNQETGSFTLDPLGKTGYQPNVESFISGVDQMLEKDKANDG